MLTTVLAFFAGAGTYHVCHLIKFSAKDLEVQNARRVDDYLGD